MPKSSRGANTVDSDAVAKPPKATPASRFLAGLENRYKAVETELEKFEDSTEDLTQVQKQYKSALQSLTKYMSKFEKGIKDATGTSFTGNAGPEWKKKVETLKEISKFVEAVTNTQKRLESSVARMGSAKKGGDAFVKAFKEINAGIDQGVKLLSSQSKEAADVIGRTLTSVMKSASKQIAAEANWIPKFKMVGKGGAAPGLPDYTSSRYSNFPYYPLARAGQNFQAAGAAFSVTRQLGNERFKVAPPPSPQTTGAPYAKFYQGPPNFGVPAKMEYPVGFPRENVGMGMATRPLGGVPEYVGDYVHAHIDGTGGWRMGPIPPPAGHPWRTGPTWTMGTPATMAGRGSGGGGGRGGIPPIGRFGAAGGAALAGFNHGGWGGFWGGALGAVGGLVGGPVGAEIGYEAGKSGYALWDAANEAMNPAMEQQEKIYAATRATGIDITKGMIGGASGSLKMNPDLYALGYKTPGDIADLLTAYGSPLNANKATATAGVLGRAGKFTQFRSDKEWAEYIDKMTGMGVVSSDKGITAMASSIGVSITKGLERVIPPKTTMESIDKSLGVIADRPIVTTYGSAAQFATGGNWSALPSLRNGTAQANALASFNDRFNNMGGNPLMTAEFYAKFQHDTGSMVMNDKNLAAFAKKNHLPYNPTKEARSIFNRYGATPFVMQMLGDALGWGNEKMFGFEHEGLAAAGGGGARGRDFANLFGGITRPESERSKYWADFHVGNVGPTPKKMGLGIDMIGPDGTPISFDPKSPNNWGNIGSAPGLSTVDISANLKAGRTSFGERTATALELSNTALDLFASHLSDANDAISTFVDRVNDKLGVHAGASVRVSPLPAHGGGIASMGTDTAAAGSSTPTSLPSPAATPADGHTPKPGEVRIPW